MKIIALTKLMVMTKVSTPSADGTKTYHKLGVVNESECGMVSCNKEIYESVSVGKTYDFECAYDDKYSAFRLSRLLGATK